MCTPTQAPLGEKEKDNTVMNVTEMVSGVATIIQKRRELGGGGVLVTDGPSINLQDTGATCTTTPLAPTVTDLGSRRPPKGGHLRPERDISTTSQG